MISVVVCTRNRAKLLEKTLQRLEEAASKIRNKVEVVIVDNASFDQTPVIVRRFQTGSRVPVKYIREEQIGIAIARNSGIRSSNGEWVVFIDDDVLIAKDWLERMIEDVRAHPSVACIGGKIHFLTDSPLPRWASGGLLSQRRLGLGFMDWGDEPLIVEKGRHEKGIFPAAAVAYRREILLLLGGFNERFKRSEDHDLFERFLNKGFQALYDPRLMAFHCVEAHRLSRTSAAVCHFWSVGWNYALLSFKGRKIFGIPLYMLRYFLREMPRSLLPTPEGTYYRLRMVYFCAFFLRRCLLKLTGESH